MTFIWGANIHHSYTLPVAQQLALAKAIGLTSLRIDVYDASADTIAWLAPMVTQSAGLGISILPVLLPGLASSEMQAYNAGKVFGAAIATAVPHVIGFECGNELDEFCGIPGHDGTKTTDYNTAKYGLVRGGIKGMIAGVKMALPAMPVGVNVTGTHWGMLQRLANDGVRWDATTNHIYVPPGTANLPVAADGLYPNFAHFGHPIMTTEFNQQDGSNISNDPATLIAMMGAIQGVAAKYNILGGYIYELLDQPEQPPNEAHYGLADAAGNINAFGTAVKAMLNP